MRGKKNETPRSEPTRSYWAGLDWRADARPGPAQTSQTSRARSQQMISVSQKKKK